MTTISSSRMNFQAYIHRPRSTGDESCAQILRNDGVPAGPTCTMPRSTASRMRQRISNVLRRSWRVVRFADEAFMSILLPLWPATSGTTGVHLSRHTVRRYGKPPYVNAGDGRDARWRSAVGRRKSRMTDCDPYYTLNDTIVRNDSTGDAPAIWFGLTTQDQNRGRQGSGASADRGR